jgi:hypothetical protein
MATHTRVSHAIVSLEADGRPGCDGCSARRSWCSIVVIFIASDGFIRHIRYLVMMLLGDKMKQIRTYRGAAPMIRSHSYILPFGRCGPIHDEVGKGIYAQILAHHRKFHYHKCWYLQ